jgi:hypothetical protein
MRLPNIPSQLSGAGQRITGTIGGRSPIERAVNTSTVVIASEEFELAVKIN